MDMYMPTRSFILDEHPRCRRRQRHSEPVLLETCNSFRAFMRPFVGAIAAVRKDNIKQTTTSKKWQSHARGPNPFVPEHATGYKH